MESEFFALLDVLNKFAALFGPFLVAVVADATGDIRLSLVPILLFLLGGLVPLYYVDLAAGKEDACQFAKERIGNELSNSV